MARTLPAHVALLASLAALALPAPAAAHVAPCLDDVLGCSADACEHAPADPVDAWAHVHLPGDGLCVQAGVACSLAVCALPPALPPLPPL